MNNRLTGNRAPATGIWKRVGILAAVFVVAVIVISAITNRGSDDLTVDLEAATLPRVHFLVEGQEVNALVGYKDEMDLTAMRDTITPLDSEGNTEAEIERNGNTIDQVTYALSSLDGEKTYKTGAGKESNGVVKLAIGDELKAGEEANLTVTLTIDGKEVHYYTRVVAPDDLNIKECLDFVKEFHDNTFSEDGVAFVGTYLESNEDGDNNTFQTVTIHSDSNHVMWGDLAPEVKGDVQWDIKESNSTYTSILARYQVTCKEGDETTLYNVREFFRVRVNKDTLYLLDYDRTMNQVFDGSAKVLSEKGINLGIASTDAQYKTNKNGTIVSFVQERDLWSYDQKNDNLSLVFSFSNTEEDDVRNWYDQHQIRILDVENNGSTTFAVYGYMNRGQHEGHVGVNIYYYDIEKNDIEEKAFIPSNKSFVIAENELGHMVYYSKDQEKLFVVTGGTIYEVTLKNNQQNKIAEGLEEGQYAASEDGHLLAYNEKVKDGKPSKVKVMNLKTGKSYEVEGAEGETLHPLGFISSDFICGIAKESQKGKTVSGEEITPMERLEIISSKNEVVKTYQADNIYISDIIVEKNMVTVNRVTKNGDLYTGTTQDYITNNEEKNQSSITAEAYLSETKGREMRLTFEEGISDQQPKVLRPKIVEQENVTTLKLESPQKAIRYYAYGMGNLQGVYEKASYAIQKAETVSGVVISSDQHYIWEKGNRDLVYDTGVGSFKVENKTALEACRDYMQQYEASEVDLTGCTIEEILYVINKGMPVIAILDQNQAVILTAYNSGTVTYVNPATGEKNAVAFEAMDQMTAPTGHTYIGYVK